MSVATIPPATIAAGDSITFAFTVSSDYSGWTGASRLTGNGSIDGTATLDGTTLTVSVGSSETAEMSPGRCELRAWLKDSSDHRVSFGPWLIQVTPDPAGIAETTDARTHAARTLDLITAAIEARITGGAIDSYSIEGTAVNKIDLDKLYQLRAKYEAEVRSATARAIPSLVFAVPSGFHWSVR